MRIYIAAPYPCRDSARALRGRLMQAGHTVVSTWVTEDDEISEAFARKDLGEIDDADALVALNPSDFHGSGTGGRHVELGYALAKGKAIVLLGVRSNIFHELSEVRVVETAEEVLEQLGTRPADAR